MNIPRTKEGLALVPSVALTEAIEDLIKVERSKKYEVIMDWWHRPDSFRVRGGACAVCLGGAVMAKTLHAPIKDHLFPDDFPKTTKHILEGLDRARTGLWELFFMCVNQARKACGLPALPGSFGELEDQIKDSIVFIRYEDDKAAFKRNMRKAVRIMREAGL